MDCTACGLTLPEGLAACPACEAAQVLAVLEATACVHHRDASATSACPRCGVLLCGACAVGADGECAACVTDCVSCGLELSTGQSRCPACGTEQALRRAAADEARCATHPEVRASRTCLRCGAFLCVACDVEAEGACAACVVTQRREVVAQRAATKRRLVAGALVHAALGPLILLLGGNGTAAAVLGVGGVVGSVAALASLVSERWLELTFITGAFASLIGLWLVVAHPVMVLPLALAVGLFVQLGRLGRLEREAWRLSRRG